MSDTLERPGGQARLWPALSGATLLTILLGGVAAVIVWEIWARVITPLWIGGPLEPAGLIQAVFGLNDRTLPEMLPLAVPLGLSARDVAEILHFIVGLIGYPIGYIFIARPLAGAILPGLPWWVVSLLYGVALWVFALYVMAHLAAGFPPFLGFIQLTWASLVGHVLFALALGAVVRARMGAFVGTRHD